MLHRFEGVEGRRRLIDALKGQAIVQGDEVLATELAGLVSLELHAPGTAFIKQGDDDNRLFLILSGSVSIVVNRHQLARRYANQHVGEMTVIDPTARRSASVIALDECVTASIPEHHFADLANRYPQLWRRIARTLGERLRERNSHVPQRREIPCLFIGSSRENIAIADTVKAALAGHPVNVAVWTTGVFGASSFPLLDLEAQLHECDFALLVANPDDEVKSRGVTKGAPRDNVIFELGLFMGALSHERVFYVHPRGVDNKIPSDLLGLSPMQYEDDAAKSLEERLEPVCVELRGRILKTGPK